MQLITKSFQKEALAFPSRVDQALSEVESIEQAKDMLDKGAALQHYAERLKAGVEIERPISLGVLKIKAKIGELLPARHPGDRGQGRNGNSAKSSSPAGLDLAKGTIAGYRKLADHRDKLDEYYQNNADDVPTQTDFLKWVAAPHVSRNSGNNEWYTPPEYLDAARDVLGGFDLDPASSDIAQGFVQAAQYFTEDDDGLSEDWSGRVWMNPPYAQPAVRHFCEKLCTHVDSGEVTAACVLVNNATETDWFQGMARRSQAICFPDGRVRFVDEDGNTGAPLQGQAVLYVGRSKSKFAKRFSKFGFVLCRT